MEGGGSTNEDKRRAVMTLLQDAEWARWSDSEIARRCGVNQSTVSRIRAELSPMQSISEPRTYVDKHGNVTTMSVANIGRPSIGFRVAEAGFLGDDFAGGLSNFCKILQKFGPLPLPIPNLLPHGLGDGYRPLSKGRGPYTIRRAKSTKILTNL